MCKAMVSINQLSLSRIGAGRTKWRTSIPHRTNPKPTIDPTKSISKTPSRPLPDLWKLSAMRRQAGFLTEEEEARQGADEGGVGNAVDGEVEARVPLGVQIIQWRDPRLGRRG